MSTAAAAPALKFIRASDWRRPDPLEHGHRWGDWRLSLTEPPSLDYIGEPYRAHRPYEVTLSSIFDQTTYLEWPGLVNWIQHLSEKYWGAASIGDFTRAIMDIKSVGLSRARRTIRQNESVRTDNTRPLRVS